MCSPRARAEEESASRKGGPRAYVVLVAGRVRDKVALARILPAPPPPEHSEIHVAAEGVPRMETKDAIVLANLWDEYVAACEALASIATIPPEYRSAPAA